jgi:hypothetical protein
MLHLAATVALAITAMGALLAWRAERADAPSVSAAQATARARDMAWAGLAFSVWFAIMILATEVPVLVLPPCTP